MNDESCQYSGTPGWVARVNLPAPSLQDNTADADRLGRALRKEFGFEALDMDLGLCRQLPLLLRENHYTLRCVACRDSNRGILIHAGPDDAHLVLAGLAIDLGTTRVVMRLMDLDNGRTLTETAFDNPQIAIGPDILARIHHTDQPDGLWELNHSLI